MKLKYLILIFLIFGSFVWGLPQDSLKVDTLINSAKVPQLNNNDSSKTTFTPISVAANSVAQQKSVDSVKTSAGGDSITKMFDFNIVKDITLFTLLEVLVLLIMGLLISKAFDWISKIFFKKRFITFVRPVFVIMKIVIWIILFHWILSLFVKTTNELLLLFFVIMIVISSVAAIPMIRNLVGGFYISLEKPFDKGDFISITSYSGEIRDLGWRSTSILTDDKSLVYIPNSVFLTNPLENLNVGQKEQLYTLKFEFPIEYDVSKILSIIKDGALASPYTFIHNQINVYLEKSDFIKGSNIFKLNLYLFDSKYENELLHSINTLILKSIQNIGNN